MKRISVLFLFLILSGMPVFSQSNAILDEYLALETASFRHSAYIILSAANLIPEDASVEDALTKLDSLKWLPVQGKEQETINLGDLSFLVMKAFDLPGGLLYSLFPSPRYAVRELLHRGIIINHGNPNRQVSSEEAMRIIRMGLDWKGVRS